MSNAPVTQMLGFGVSLLLQISAGAPGAQDFDSVKTAIQAVLDRGQVPAAGIALVTRDKVLWTGALGKADLASGKPATAATMFRTGSISKSFVGLALAKLEEEDRIDLDAPLRTIAPELQVENPWENRDPVRVANLLEHTAGFDDMAPKLRSPLPEGIPLLEAFRREPQAYRARWAPGTRMAYSNPGYGVAGYVIEKITGMRFEEYIEQAILRPLGMTRSGFRMTDEIRNRMAQGYTGVPPRPMPYPSFNYYRPAGGFLTCPEEFAHFLRMWLNRGRLGDARIVGPQTVERVEQPRTTLAARAGLRVGYGLGNFTNLAFPSKRQGHGGSIPGFNATYQYLPEDGVAYCVLLNKDRSVAALRQIDRLLYDYLTAGLPRRPAPATRLAEEELRKYAAFYRPANSRDRVFEVFDVLSRSMRLVVDRGVLYQTAIFSGPRRPLTPVTPITFRYAHEPEASLVFTTTEDGARVLTGPLVYFVAESAFRAYVRWLAILGTTALMCTSVLFALVWIPPGLLRRRPVPHMAVRLLPLTAVLVFALAMVTAATLAFGGEIEEVIPANVRAVGYQVLSWGFAALSFTSLAVARRSFAWEMRPAVRIHSLAVAAACCVMAVLLASWGLLGFRLLV